VEASTDDASEITAAALLSAEACSSVRVIDFFCEEALRFEKDRKKKEKKK